MNYVLIARRYLLIRQSNWIRALRRVRALHSRPQDHNTLQEAMWSALQSPVVITLIRLILLLIHSSVDWYPTSVTLALTTKPYGHHRKQLLTIYRIYNSQFKLCINDFFQFQNILNALHRATEGRTSICIAHRLSTVMDADEIFVLDGGRIGERGTHAELLRKSGLYVKLWETQNKFSVPLKA